MALRIAEQVIDALRARGWKAGTAESCTGGLVAAWLTDVAGSSEVVAGGIVSYSNAVKQDLLGVKEATLAAHGAVSEETAIEMVLGAQKALGVEVAVSITGIAGPGGGSADKPVGLTWLGLAAPGGVLHTERHVWPGDREAVRSASAMRALELLLEAAEKERR